MGLFNIVKNNGNDSNNIDGKYLDFDLTHMPQKAPNNYNNQYNNDTPVYMPPEQNRQMIGQNQQMMGQVQQSQQMNGEMPKGYPNYDMPMEMPEVRQEQYNTMPSYSEPIVQTPPVSTIKPSFNNSNNNEQHIVAPTGVMKQNDVVKSPVEEIDTLEEIKEETVYEKESKNLDPLDNSKNPIPVNPVAPLQEEFYEQDYDLKNVKANLFSLFGMIMGMTLKPGTTIINNAKKYRDASKAYMITIWITLVSLALSFVVRVLVGSFVRTTNAVTGASHLQFNPAFLFTPENYIEYFALAILVSGGAILVTSLIYYASSFLNSKGVPLGSYVMISNLSMLPLIAGVVLIYPVISLFSKILGIAVVIFTILYSLITFFIGMNRILTFKNIDRQILYNVLNLSAIMMAMIILIVILIKIDILVMPELVL